jgi:hypothetical protein
MGFRVNYIQTGEYNDLNTGIKCSSILGKKKTAVYVSLVTVASTPAGWLFGLALATW